MSESLHLFYFVFPHFFYNFDFSHASFIIILEMSGRHFAVKGNV